MRQCQDHGSSLIMAYPYRPAGWNASIPLRRPLTAYTLRGSASLTLNQGKPRLTINGSGQAAPILVVVLRWSQALKMITTGPLCQPLGHFAIVEAGLDSKWRLAVFWRPIRNPTLSIDGLIWKDDRYISSQSTTACDCRRLHADPCA